MVVVVVPLWGRNCWEECQTLAEARSKAEEWIKETRRLSGPEGKRHSFTAYYYGAFGKIEEPFPGKYGKAMLNLETEVLGTDPFTLIPWEPAGKDEVEKFFRRLGFPRKLKGGI